MKTSRSLAICISALLLAVSAEAGTVTVTSSADAGGSCPGATCTLRQAITTAGSGDTVVFQIPTTDSGYNAATGAFTIALGSELLIAKSLTIDGNGSKIVLGGAGGARVFHVTAGTVVLAKLRITGANLQGVTSEGGAGILNKASLTVRECTIHGNNGGSNTGGGIRNNGILLLTNCTVSGNATNGQIGPAPGAGIVNFAGATLTIDNSTIADNQTRFPSEGCGIYNQNGATARLRNTVVARNNALFSGSSDTVGSFVSDGFNFIGDASQSTGFMAGSHDQFGTSASPSDPKLGVLQDNGGPSLTHAPQAASPLIDTGNRGTDAGGQPINFDQRGQPRPVARPEANGAGSDGSDIGAVERGPAQAGPNFIVTTIVERFGEGCMTDDCSLLSAMNAANANADASTITFAPYVQGSILNTIVPGGLNIVTPMTISGPGSRVLTISGNNASRLFNIASGVTATISGLTIANANTGANSGGGVLNSGTLTLQDCAVVNNSGGSGGGAVNSGTLNVNNCTFAGNQSTGNGGALRNAGVMTLTNSTFYNNKSVNSGAISSFVSSGPVAMVTLTNCTVSGNLATDANAQGGGLFNGTLSTTTVRNTIVSRNNLNNSANGFDVYGSFTSGGSNIIRFPPVGTGFTDGNNGDQVGTLVNNVILFKDPNLDTLKNNGGLTDTLALLSPSIAIDKGKDVNAPQTDQRGYFRNGTSDVGAFEFNGTAALPPGLVGNVSTRLPVGTGDNVLIEGFIVQGPAGSTKKIMVRAIGPSLIPFGIADALGNPTLEIRDASNALIAANDDWGNTQVGGIITGDQSAEISGSGLAPGNSLESAIIANLAPGSYTAVVRGVGDTVGTGVVDAYDMSATSAARLANVATRGLIQPGDKLMIAGFIIQNGSVTAVVRAIGPSLSAFGISNALPDTTLQLRDQNGVIVRENDDWQSDQQQELQNTGLQPSDPLEAAILVTIPAGQYTVQVRGKPETTGIGVVQVYFLQ